MPRFFTKPPGRSAKLYLVGLLIGQHPLMITVGIDERLQVGCV